MTRREALFTLAIVVGAIALVTVTALFAPVINGGWCADADDTGTSMCGTFQRSIVGIDTNVWLWVIPAASIVIGTLAVAWGARRSMR